MRRKKTILALLIFFIIVNILLFIWIFNIRIEETGVTTDQILLLFKENILFVALGVSIFLLIIAFYFMARTP